jgi:hypothetical protein
MVLPFSTVFCFLENNAQAKLSLWWFGAASIDALADVR